MKLESNYLVVERKESFGNVNDSLFFIKKGKINKHKKQGSNIYKLSEKKLSKLEEKELKFINESIMKGDYEYFNCIHYGFDILSVCIEEDLEKVILYVNDYFKEDIENGKLFNSTLENGLYTLLLHYIKDKDLDLIYKSFNGVYTEEEVNYKLRIITEINLKTFLKVVYALKLGI